VTLALAWLTLTAAVTFDGARPVLAQHCQPCHRPGGIAPMAFTTYSQTRPWAKAIREAILSRRMPPWFAARASVQFANDPTLTAPEKQTLLDWIAAGAPRGRQPEPPPAKPSPWSFPPDLTLTAPQAFSVPARTTVEYQYLILPVPQSASDRWIDRVEIRPSTPALVHHAVAYIREPGDAWLKDAPRGVFHVPPPADRVTKADILAVYTPGARALTLPPGFAKKLPAGAEIVLQFHYTAHPQRTLRDRTSLALGFARAPIQKRVLTLQMGVDKIEIPPGERRHRLSVTGTLPGDTLLMSLMPHMHLRGSEFEFEILREGGQVETLLQVKPFDFHWQLTYWLTRPRPLPKGTRLRFTGYFDNSPNNPRNPDPTATVTWGEQSWQEMMIGFFDVAVDPGASKPEFFRQR